MPALRKVFIANPAPSVIVEVQRGAESHSFRINKRGDIQKGSLRRSSANGDGLELATTPSSRQSQDSNFDQTQLPTCLTAHETSKSGGSMHQQSTPEISPPPLLPRSDEQSNIRGLQMLTGALKKGEIGNLLGPSRKGSHDDGSADAPATPNSSGNSVLEGWIGKSNSSTLSSSTHRRSPLGGGGGAWETLSEKRTSSAGIEELEKELIETVNALTTQRDIADVLVFELSVLKKNISSTARFSTPRPRLDRAFWIARSHSSSCCLLCMGARGGRARWRAAAAHSLERTIDLRIAQVRVIKIGRDLPF